MKGYTCDDGYSSSGLTNSSPLNLHGRSAPKNASNCDDSDCASDAECVSSNIDDDRRHFKVNIPVERSLNQGAHSLSDESSAMIDAAQRSQHQAAMALVGADIMHKLFVDATTKIEVILSLVLAIQVHAVIS